jgi:hypothetical protein
MHQFNLLVGNKLLSNNEMVQTRSREGQNIPPAVCAHIAIRQNQAPPPPPPLLNQIDPAMQQFLAAQTQLLQNLTATVQNLQAQQNQPAPPPPPPPQPRDKHKEFISHHPPTYSHSSDPLDADEWLKTVTKKLEIVQCTDREMVLYAAGRLTGQVANWWDTYSTAHPNRNNITWQEFRDNYRTYHIPSRVIKLKQKEFLALKQETCLSLSISTSSLICPVMLLMKSTLIPRGRKDSWMDWLDHSTISCRAIHSPTFRCC